jgi:hypothetical protein
MRRCLLAMLAGLGLLSWWACPLPAQQPTDSRDDESAKAAVQAAAAHVHRMKLQSVDGVGQIVPLIEQPLLSFGDLARVYNHGTLWAWGTKGRPVAFMELFQQPKTDNGRWTQSVTLTASPNVVLETPENDRWEPGSTAFEAIPVPIASTPAEKESARLRQLKEMARRFAAHEIWDPNRSRYELRLLVQPVHRYSDPQASVQDGAVFVFAHGTNPECLLLIEALGDSLASARWHSALVRSSDAEVHVELDGREMWTCERVGRVSNERFKPYWAFHSPLEKPPVPVDETR